MGKIFYKSTSSRNLQILFLGFEIGSYKNLIFDYWKFAFVNDEDIYTDDFIMLDQIDPNSEITDIRNHDDDVFYVLFSNMTLVQISHSMDTYGEFYQSMHIFDYTDKSYGDAYIRFAASTIYALG